MTDADNGNIEGWPEALRAIAEDPRLGRETALRLSRAFGGTEIYVSRSPRSGSEVLREIGPRKCEALYDLFGGGRLLIPMGALTDWPARRQAIRRLLRAGRSHSFIARSVRCHVMTVKREHRRMVAAGERPGGQQLDIFGSPRP